MNQHKLENTVFILGAGASKDCGAPLMKDFLDQAHTLWKLDRVAGFEEDFQRVFAGIADLQHVHSKSALDIQNLEAVFAAFEMARTLKISRIGGATPKVLASSMTRVIVKTLQESVTFYPRSAGNLWDDGQAYQTFVSRLIRGLQRSSPPHRIVILTFNYDIALDVILHENGIEPDYALSEVPREGPTNETIPVLKLHGSLNWSRCSKCKAVDVRLTPDFLARRCQSKRHNDNRAIIDITGVDRAFRHSCGGDFQTDAVIVPPTWHKEDYHREVAAVWARAASELKEAENIFIIGYSLPDSDSFFRYLYGLGTQGNTPLRKVWVFNPDESAEERFRKLLGPGAEARFQFKPCPFHLVGSEREHKVKDGAKAVSATYEMGKAFGIRDV